MIKKLYIALLVLMAGLPVAMMAQDDQIPADMRERLETYKIAFFTKRLTLSSGEAQKFWPVYDEYTSEQNEVQKKQRQKQNQIRRALKSGTDREIERLVDEYLQLQKQELSIREKYHAEFKKVLPIRKVAKLYQAESAFKRKLLEEIQKRRQERLNQN